ncbi:MAG: hypothetical protein JO359_13910, partial [Candidatus Eremiobacteraeota bacterium]|nr:hypothetical protein [Candidatus Eremiobacteraeota bacterium]
AGGSADVYPRFAGTSEWDVAAAHAVANAAGAAVTDLSGVPLRYNKPSIRNPSFIVSVPGFPWERFVSDDDRARASDEGFDEPRALDDAADDRSDVGSGLRPA